MSLLRRGMVLAFAGTVGFCLSSTSNAFVPSVQRGLVFYSSTFTATERARITNAAPRQPRRGRRMRQRQQHLIALRSGDNDKSFEPGQWEPSGDSGGEGESKGKSFEPGQWDPNEAAAKSAGKANAPPPPTGGGGGMENMGDPATRSKLKAELIRKVATLNRGFVAQEADRLDVEEIIEMLELENPNPTPCEGFSSQSSPLAGRWQLLYTTSLDVLSLQVNPTVTIGQIYQNIDADGRCITNVIELQPPFAAVANRLLGSSLATLTVKLDTDPVSDTRIDLKFKRTEIQAQSLLGRDLDLPALGVDIPSGDRLQKFLSKGKKRAQGAKNKVRDMAKKAGKKVDDATDGRASEKAKDLVEEVKDKVEEAKDKADDATDGKVSEVTEKATSHDGGSGGSSDVMKPYFETTYVDEDLRVGRTGQGDLFVSTRIL